MDLHEALLKRRTVYRYEDREIPADVVDRALESARWAPNHKMTEPWRFTVLGPQTQEELGPVAIRLGQKKAAGLEGEELERALARAVSKVVEVPLIIVATYVKTPDDDFRDREDYAAACCAVHNLVLSLWADGVGAQWGTGGVTRDAETYRVVGVPEGEEIIGFIKAGYPAKIPGSKRRPLDEVVRRTP
jgi:nitroreductase